MFLDADGEPLRLGLAAGPSLIKPNVEEAERLLDRSLPDEAATLAAARELVGRGVETVIISMGGRGAVCAQDARAWRIHPPDVKRLSTVGSGDAMGAGCAVALERGEDLVRGLRSEPPPGRPPRCRRGRRSGRRTTWPPSCRRYASRRCRDEPTRCE